MPTSLQIVQRLYPEVTSVVDSKRAVTVEVTQKDCLSRAVKNHKECALAVACNKIADGAIICVKTAYLIRGTKATRYTLPASVSREITAFDRNAPFEPGEYHLARVAPSQEQGTKRKYGKKTGNGEKVHYHRTENIRESLTGH